MHGEAKMAAQIEEKRPEETPMYSCPIKSISLAWKCAKEECAWWVPQAKGCAVYVFAADIHQLVQMGNLFKALGADPSKLKDLVRQSIQLRKQQQGGDKTGKN